jgi:HEAT repeat protein
LGLVVLTFLCGIPLADAAEAAPEPAALTQAFTRLQTFDWGQGLEALQPIEDAILVTRNDPAQRHALEQRLADCLSSSAPTAAKQFVCRKLSLIGTEASVPALAALLGNAELSHIARLALERIPGAAASESLRTALPQVDDRLKVGIIQSLGVRGNTAAVAQLTRLLPNTNSAVAASAATALGQIGTPEAARALSKFRRTAPPTLRSTATDAWLSAAERLARSGERTEALAIYRHLFTDPTESALRPAALRGLVLAEPDRAFARLSNALGGDDAALRALAASLLADWPNATDVRRFADTLGSYPPAAQVALLEVFRTRRETAARPAALQMAQADNPPVRVAALQTLAVVGTASDVPLLAKLAATGRGEEREAARLALSALPGHEPSQAIAALLPDSPPPIRVELIRALAGRGATDRVSLILPHLSDSDGTVRRAALEAVAALGDERQVPPVIVFLKAAPDEAARNQAEKTLSALVTRAGLKSLEALLAGVSDAKPAARLILLEQLGSLGGSRALAAVRAAAAGEDAGLREGAFRILVAWPDWEAAPELLRCVQSSDHPTRRALAFRGYVRLCREAHTTPAERLTRVSEAARLAADTGEKTLVVSVLAEVADPGALKWLAGYLDDAALVEVAGLATVKVASALDPKHKAEVIPPLQRTLKASQNTETKMQARELLKKLGASAD